MYVPAHFQANDDALVDELIDDHSFATLVSQRDGEPFATHLPLLRERRDGRTVLVGPRCSWAIWRGPIPIGAPSATRR